LTFAQTAIDAIPCCETLNLPKESPNFRPNTPDSGLSPPKSGKMPGLEKLLSATHQLVLLDKALAWGLSRPHRSAFFVLRR
jgi:hypothetical protein